MTIIKIDPREVQDTGSKFIKMQQEVEGLVSQARGMMSKLESQFTGTRATKIFGQWNDMQQPLQSAINSLKNAGDLLNRAGQDFYDVDMR